MRISDWSSDVCSSDLTCGGKCTSTRSAPRGRGGRLACRSPRRGPWSATWAASSAVTIAGGVRALAPHIVWEVHVWREVHEYALGATWTWRATGVPVASPRPLVHDVGRHPGCHDRLGCSCARSPPRV